MYHPSTPSTSTSTSNDIRLAVAPSPTLASPPHHQSLRSSLTADGSVSKRGWKVFGGWTQEDVDREREREREARESAVAEVEADSNRLSRPRSLILPSSPRPPLPVRLLSTMMGPFGALVLSQPQQPGAPPHFYGDSKSASSLHGLGIGMSSGSSSPIHGGPASKRRSPLLLRLVGAAYVLFALAFFSARLSGLYHITSQEDAALARRSFGQDGQQVVDGSGSAVDGTIPGMTGWSEKWRDGIRYGTERWSNSIGGLRRLKGAVQEKAVEAGNGLSDTVNAAVQHKTPSPLDDLVPAIFPDKDVRRTWAHQADSSNPLSELSHQFRFSKMFSKVQWGAHDEIDPYTFTAEAIEGKGAVTACMYSNEAWLSELPAFVSAWGGPVSLVFESAHGRSSNQRTNLVTAITRLRHSNPQIRDLVDFHLVSAPTTSQLTVNRTRERLITRPTGTNFHLNLARTFARTEAIWVVGDARVFPSPGLRDALQTEDVSKRILQAGDAIVVPTFGFLRPQSENPYTDADGDLYVGPRPSIPPVADLRVNLGLPVRGAGVNQKEFARLSSEYVAAHHRTLPMQMETWPKTKKALLDLALSETETGRTPVIVGHDATWDPNKGPTNFALWQLESGDARLEDPAIRGGGNGLGFKNGIGGGSEMYRVAEYDMHYAPNIVMAKHGQPWCTERFDDNKAACVYQVYLGGAELWVLPGEWAYTIDVVEKTVMRMDSARKLERSITNKMYTKYHQEACMQYGRQFLSMDMWDHPKAKHLRFMCDRILTSYGMGVASSD